MPERRGREPTMADLRQLMGASTPHFALQIRNRIRNLVGDLAADHPVRVDGEREIRRLEQIAFAGEVRGPAQEGQRPLPSLKPDPEAERRQPSLETPEASGAA
jgi:hypothetical protein